MWNLVSHFHDYPCQRRGNYIWLCLSVCSHRMLASCPLAIHCRRKPSQDKMACELLISLDLLRLIPMTVHQYAKIHSRSDSLLVFEVRSCRTGMLSTFYILYPHAHSKSDGLLVFEVRSCRAGMLSTFYILYPHTHSMSDGLLVFEVRSCRAGML